MKRANHLIEHMATFDNVALAFWKAAKGKQGNAAIEQSREHLYEQIAEISEQLATGNMPMSQQHRFVIFDPKEREICAVSFPERVFHHAIMNVCHPIFERYQIFDSYASRKNKGVFAAIERAHYFQKKHLFFLKLDVRKHFETIDHDILKKMLARLFKDVHVLQLFSQIIDSYEVQPKKGLPIGNLTSQYFANHYLAVADHFIKEQLKIKAYVRYMDDMVLWHHDLKQLLDAGKQLATFFETKLQLTLKPFCLNHTHKGLPFLGYVISPQHIHLNKRSRKRFKSKLVIYETNRIQKIWNEATYQRHILPLLAFTKKADSFLFRQKILKQQNMDAYP